MIANLLKKIFGTHTSRYIQGLRPIIAQINQLEPAMQGLGDEALRAKTDEFKTRISNGESLDKLLPEAFAVVREASVRTLQMRHFDVQLIGGIVLHQGKIAEMKTGEGKTLVATLPTYLNALTGKGVHVVTVNDYLARRDAEWMGQIFQFLGLSVGVVIPSIDDEQRKNAYECDILYGTNNELGFDYLRDNLKLNKELMVQRPHHFAIVDEVDSILIDEARTPLIISGQADTPMGHYQTANAIIPLLPDSAFELDEKNRSVIINESGMVIIENILREQKILNDGDNLYDIHNISLVHHIDSSLRAHKLFKRDKDYIVRGQKIVIIDEFTGRMLDGRRYSEGLHQAIEAKEGVPIQPENQTIASITFQNYFRQYQKLAGMTGTALTEANEFLDIYNLDVIDIPTNRPMIRKDMDDEVYRTSEERDDAVVAEIKGARERGQPVLVGTVTIEKSEQFSKKLKQLKIPHQVLNARFHEQEAQIIAEAGVGGAVTIATNMAGRGTDIQLGGNLKMQLEKAKQTAKNDNEYQKMADEISKNITIAREKILQAGGLYVIGTERHESRRIDNQLRGRSGRQGDAGASKFFVSLQDDLMRIFGSDKLDGMLVKLGLEKGEAIVHPWINKALEKAQQKVEQRNYEIRKQLLKFDDVMNDQRKVIFDQRREIMNATDLTHTIDEMREQLVNDLVEQYLPDNQLPQQWVESGQAKLCANEFTRIFGVNIPVDEWVVEEGTDKLKILERIEEITKLRISEKVEKYGNDIMNHARQSLLLQILDHHWKEHLLHLDQLRMGIGLRAYGQRDPLNEYKQEAFQLFEYMLSDLQKSVVGYLAKLTIEFNQNDGENTNATDNNPPQPNTNNGAGNGAGDKIKRNDPCPCGSGKKYKHCHGA